MMDYEVVKSYGARIYSRINVACPGCNAILLCDQDHRDFIKEAVEHGVYACSGTSRFDFKWFVHGKLNKMQSM